MNNLKNPAFFAWIVIAALTAVHFYQNLPAYRERLLLGSAIVVFHVIGIALLLWMARRRDLAAMKLPLLAFSGVTLAFGIVLAVAEARTGLQGAWELTELGGSLRRMPRWGPFLYHVANNVAAAGFVIGMTLVPGIKK